MNQDKIMSTKELVISIPRDNNFLRPFYYRGSAWGFRETGRLAFLFLGRREIMLILGRFYLKEKGD